MRPYCDRLGIEPPNLEAFEKPHSIKRFYLLVAALLERGAPMTLDEIAARIEAIDPRSQGAELKKSLQTSWHGQRPVFRDPDDRFALQLDAYELWQIIWSLGLERASSTAPHLRPVPANPDESLTRAELEHVLRGRYAAKVGLARAIASALDISGTAMTRDEVSVAITTAVRAQISIADVSLPNLRSKLIEELEDGRLALRSDRKDELHTLRKFMRDVGRTDEAQRARDTEAARFLQAYERRKVEQAEVASKLRRCILRVVVDPTKPQAGALLDIQARSIRSFTDVSSVPDLARALDDYDVIVGLDAGAAIEGLGRDPTGWKVIDLRSTQKTRQINQSGRTLKLTAEMLMRSTIGAGNPLGDPQKTKYYLATGDHTKLAKRLGSDVKALLAYYNYGKLHNSVRLRWGFLDDSIPVEWSLDGDPHLYEVLRRAVESGSEVDLVAGRSAPGWSDPWARAFRAEIIELEAYEVIVSAGGEIRTINRDDIQAARIAEG